MKKTKKKRKVTEKDGKFYSVKGVELTRNFHTMTEAEYFSMILSALRRTTRYWRPATEAMKKASRPSESSNKRIKTEYQCNHCKEWFKGGDIQKDHIIPCGGINSYAKIVPWLKKAHIEDLSGFQILCKPCHKIKSKEEKNNE